MITYAPRPPNEPKKQISVKLSSCYTSSVKDAYNEIKEKYKHLTDMELSCEDFINMAEARVCYGYYDETTVEYHLYYYRTMTEEEWVKTEKKYQRDLKKYNKELKAFVKGKK